MKKSSGRPQHGFLILLPGHLCRGLVRKHPRHFSWFSTNTWLFHLKTHRSFDMVADQLRLSRLIFFLVERWHLAPQRCGDQGRFVSAVQGTISWRPQSGLPWLSRSCYRHGSPARRAAKEWPVSRVDLDPVEAWEASAFFAFFWIFGRKKQRMFLKHLNISQRFWFRNFSVARCAEKLLTNAVWRVHQPGPILQHLGKTDVLYMSDSCRSPIFKFSPLNWNRIYMNLYLYPCVRAQLFKRQQSQKVYLNLYPAIKLETDPGLLRKMMAPTTAFRRFRSPLRPLPSWAICAMGLVD